MRRRRNSRRKRNIFLGVFLILIAVIISVIFLSEQTHAQTPARFWEINAVDTMKYSRDTSRDPHIYQLIPGMVQGVADLHANYIAIATPYDEEFYPVLKAWVSEARKYHLHVWFRGNFSGWEGWFGYPPITSVDQHNTLTAAFIQKHPDLFEAGDIFTPIPEPENGGPGDPRDSSETPDAYNQMLLSSYNNCVSSFAKINVQVSCGYFSMNADIAKQVLTPQTVGEIGNVVVIDHYVSSPQEMNDDVTFLENKFPTAHIILGEFGAPIPDINGNMTEEEQASFIQSLLQVFYNHRSRISGVDYWTLAGGSTALLNDNMTQRKAAQVINSYYAPLQIIGSVTDTLGNTLSGVQIKDDSDTIIATTDSHGDFVLPSLSNRAMTLTFQGNGYSPLTQTLPVSHGTVGSIQLKPLSSSLFYTLKVFFKNLLTI